MAVDEVEGHGCCADIDIMDLRVFLWASIKVLARSLLGEDSY